MIHDILHMHIIYTHILTILCQNCRGRQGGIAEAMVTLAMNTSLLNASTAMAVEAPMQAVSDKVHEVGCASSRQWTQWTRMGLGRAGRLEIGGGEGARSRAGQNSAAGRDRLRYHLCIAGV